MTSGIGLSRKVGAPALIGAQADVEGFNHVDFVELPFPDFAGDVETRWQAMNGVLQKVIDSYEDPHILDIASGGGHDTLYLLQRGYRVDCNEFDPLFLKQLREKAAAQGLNPTIYGVDWRDFSESEDLKAQSYDVLFALGNSFPNYLFTSEDRQKALKGFWEVLKPGGTLFFDVRNYDYILGDAENILQDPEHNFRYTYGNTYINKEIEGYPVEIEPERVRMRYKHFGNRNWSELDLCPAPISSVLSDISEALGDQAEVELFYDYQPDKPEHYDFVQFVVRKPVEHVVRAERLELDTLPPLAQLLIHIKQPYPSGPGARTSMFHAILVDPQKGKAVVRPWVGGGQRNAGYRDAMSTIGTRPYIEDSEPIVEITGEEEVNWGGLTFGDELVIRNEEGANTTFFTAFQVDAVEVAVNIQKKQEEKE